MVVPSVAAGIPVSYLYNGVVLPALPEWDESAYPYAYIGTFGGKDSTHFIATDYDISKYIYVPGADHIFTPMNCVRYVLSDGAWIEDSLWVGFTPFWANTNVYYANEVENGDLAGTLYLAASEPVPVVEDIEDGGSILDVLNSILDYDVATFNLLTYGTNRIRYIERYVASILEAITPSEEEAALRESTKETTQAVNDSLFADDAPTKVTVDDVTDVAQVGSAAAQMFNPGVGVSAFFDAFNNINLVSLFTQASIDDMYAVDEATTFSLGEDDGVVDYYTENINKIKEFVGSGD